MKNIIYLLITFLLLGMITIPAPIIAQDDSVEEEIQKMREEMERESNDMRENMKKEAEEFRKKMQQEKEAVRKQMQEQKLDILQKIQEEVKSKLPLTSREVINGTLQSINGNTLTILSTDTVEYAVKITENTKILRRFAGTSDLSEFAIGDEIHVVGITSNNEHTAVEAIIIRNKSIQRRFGVALGTVTAISGNTITLDLINKPDTSVTVSNTTKLVNRRQETIAPTDIKVGHRIRVKGTLDSTVHTVTDVNQIKDFSLPASQPTSTITPTQ